MRHTTASHAVTVIGIDMGMSTLHMVGLDSRGTIVLREKISRGRITSRLANLPRCLVGIEVNGHALQSRPPGGGQPRSCSHVRLRRPVDASRFNIGPGPKSGLQREETMRKFVDCREVPSESNCTIAISADSESELLEAAVQHAVAVHKHEDTPELRKMIRSAMKDGTPPVAAPSRAG